MTLRGSGVHVRDQGVVEGMSSGKEKRKELDVLEGGELVTLRGGGVHGRDQAVVEGL